MASRSLSTYEMLDFLNHHDHESDLVREHEAMFNPVTGYRSWDQVLYSMGYDEWGLPLPIPPRGLAVNDEAYGVVVIFPDAKGGLHYSATDNESLIAEIQKPIYSSDPDYWELYESIAKRYAEVAAGAWGVAEWLPVAAGVLGLGLLFVVARGR